MITRRGVVQLGAAMAASPAVLAKVASDGTARPGSRIVDALVADSGSAEGEVFARTATTHGLVVHRFQGDLTEVYYSQLAPQWRQRGPHAIGGLTRISPLFYLERLAWDCGMRVTFLGRHAATHDVRGPQASIDLFHGLMRVVDWPAATAHTLRQLSDTASPLRPLSAVRDAAIAGDQALFSWVLSPIGPTRVPGHELAV
jgi:hypothetical protein